MNQTRLKSLERSVRECDGACNDGDYICLCRPMDAQEALTSIRQLQAENKQLRTLLSEWIAEADSGELDGVDLELLRMTDDALKPRGEE